MKGSRPEWCSSTIYQAWHTPFWLGTLDIKKIPTHTSNTPVLTKSSAALRTHIRLVTALLLLSFSPSLHSLLWCTVLHLPLHPGASANRARCHMFPENFWWRESAPALQTHIAVCVGLAVNLETEMGVEHSVTHLAFVQHPTGADVVLGTTVLFGALCWLICCYDWGVRHRCGVGVSVRCLKTNNCLLNSIQFHSTLVQYR